MLLFGASPFLRAVPSERHRGKPRRHVRYFSNRPEGRRWIAGSTKGGVSLIYIAFSACDVWVPAEFFHHRWVACLLECLTAEGTPKGDGLGLSRDARKEQQPPKGAVLKIRTRRIVISVVPA